jgi:hypothetical protein
MLSPETTLPSPQPLTSRVNKTYHFLSIIVKTSAGPAHQYFVVCFFVCLLADGLVLVVTIGCLLPFSFFLLFYRISFLFFLALSLSLQVGAYGDSSNRGAITIYSRSTSTANFALSNKIVGAASPSLFSTFLRISPSGLVIGKHKYNKPRYIIFSMSVCFVCSVLVS